MRIGVLGATGPAGRSIAGRLADLGFDVTVGSRDAGRAQTAVDGLQQRWGARLSGLRAGTNSTAVADADLVVLAVPSEAAAALARDLEPALAGKVIVSMANALTRGGDGFEAIVPPEGSIAAAVQAAVPDGRVVAAFHHLPARELGSLDDPVDGDVLLCSDDRDAARQVVDLAAKIPGVRAFDVGDLANAVGIEAFTAVMLSINLRYRTRVGLRLTGVDGDPAGLAR